MSWANVAVEIATGKVLLVTGETESIDLDRYERHVVPCYEVGDEIRFGIHDITRLCPCQPRIEEDQYYDIVVHQDRKPN